MEIIVSGHQVDTSEALRDRVDERLNAIAEKYFARAISAQVTFGKGPHDHGFLCDIVAHVMQGVVLKGSGRAGEANAAFDMAAERIEEQLRRDTRSFEDHSGHPSTAEALAQQTAGYTIFDAGHEEEEAADNPPIVAETRVDIPEASVSDAVMMLDLRNTNALMFKNMMSGDYNMVYRRGDGTIGWVEPRAR